VWPLYDTYDIYLGEPGAPQQRKLTSTPGYDAEATIDWHTGWMYFTSVRSGDLDIWRQNLNTGGVEQLTDEYGYDGGPFISYDGKTVVYRREFFKNQAERDDYAKLLKQDLYRPGNLELMVMNADGSGKRQLTNNGASNFAPFLHPDNKTLIFCSNLHDPHGHSFELFIMPLSGGEPERVTYSDDFNGFPMFSPDGKCLAWCSDRNASMKYETNVFLAEWVP